MVNIFIRFGYQVASIDLKLDKTVYSKLVSYYAINRAEVNLKWEVIFALMQFKGKIEQI